MTDGPRQKFSVSIIDGLSYGRVVYRWFDSRPEADAEVARLAGQGVAAVVEVASGIQGWSSDHDRGAHD